MCFPYMGTLRGDWSLELTLVTVDFLRGVAHTASFWTKHTALVCLVALEWEREDFSSIFEDVDLLSLYKTAQ